MGHGHAKAVFQQGLSLAMSVSVFSVPSSSESAIAPVTWPCCSLQGLSWVERQQRRRQAIAALGLGGQRNIPPWDEAVQLAAQFLGVPMAVVTLADHQTEYIRAAYGLSSLGVGNPLSQQRQLSLEQGLGLYVLDSEQPLLLADTTDNPVTAQSELVNSYGIRAYGGVPLVTTEGICIGTLAVMDSHPRPFTGQELHFLAMAARWGMSEHERQLAASGGVALPLRTGAVLDSPLSPEALVNAVKLNLISQLTQDLRNPLTTVMGMATMLRREIYGPLTQKQREYTDIVCQSSQMLSALVNEIIDLGAAETDCPELVPTSVDIGALGQQVISALTALAEKSTQTLSFTVEPGENHWILDQRTVKQILYHLTFSLMQVAGMNSNLCIHACRRGQTLSLVMWLANPWLGEGLPAEVLEVLQEPDFTADCPSGMTVTRPSPALACQELLGLQLSQLLAQRHGGQIKVQGSPDSSCHLVVLLPGLDAAKARAEANHASKAMESLA